MSETIDTSVALAYGLQIPENISNKTFAIPKSIRKICSESKLNPNDVAFNNSKRKNEILFKILAENHQYSNEQTQKCFNFVPLFRRLFVWKLIVSLKWNLMLYTKSYIPGHQARLFEYGFRSYKSLST